MNERSFITFVASWDKPSISLGYTFNLKKSPYMSIFGLIFLFIRFYIVYIIYR